MGIGAAVVIAVGVGAAAVIGVNWFRSPRALPVGPGDPAPDFELRFAQGTHTGHLSEVAGAPLLLAFVDTRWDHALEQLWRLEGLHRRYRHRGLRVAAVARDQDAARLAAYLREATVTYPVFSDPGGAVTQPLYGDPAGRPLAFLLRRDGRIEQVLLDPTATPQRLTGAVEDLLRRSAR